MGWGSSSYVSREVRALTLECASRRPCRGAGLRGWWFTRFRPYCGHWSCCLSTVPCEGDLCKLEVADRRERFRAGRVTDCRPSRLPQCSVAPVLLPCHSPRTPHSPCEFPLLPLRSGRAQASSSPRPTQEVPLVQRRFHRRPQSCAAWVHPRGLLQSPRLSYPTKFNRWCSPRPSRPAPHAYPPYCVRLVPAPPPTSPPPPPSQVSIPTHTSRLPSVGHRRGTPPRAL